MISKCWTENPVNQRERKKNRTGNSNQRGTLNFFFIFCFSSSKNNAQLVPQYLKKLKTLQNISFVYIYLYIYLYLYNLFFFVFQTAAVRVGGCWRPREIPPVELQSETQTQVELFWQATAALNSLKHTMHMILASLSARTNTVLQPNPPRSNTWPPRKKQIEKKSMTAECFGPGCTSICRAPSSPQLCPLYGAGRDAGRVCVCASSPSQGVSA